MCEWAAQLSGGAQMLPAVATSQEPVSLQWPDWFLLCHCVLSHLPSPLRHGRVAGPDLQQARPEDLEEEQV